MTRLLSPLVVLLTLAASGAGAQTLVYDPTAAAKLVQQYENALQQLEQLKIQGDQGRRLFEHFNTPSGVNNLAPDLASPASRDFLPDTDRYLSAAKGQLSSLGDLGAAAGAIRSANRVFTPPTDDPNRDDLEAAGDRAARDLALGQKVTAVSASRLKGLQTLQTSIDGATDARAVMDLQARLQAEQALISNDQVRLQGLAMMQAAQERVQSQRDRERAAKTHSDAEAAFRRGIR